MRSIKKYHRYAHHGVEVVVVEAFGEQRAPLQLNIGHPAAGGGLQPSGNGAQSHILDQIACKERHAAQEGCPKQVSLKAGKAI